jgi:hypothetical protein
MNKLPKELLFKIMSYTYEIQDKSMLEDIRSFHESRQIIYAIYLEKWGYSINEHHADWIINDIGIFMNDNIPSMFGYCKKCKDIIHRNPFVKNAEKYILCTEVKHVDSQINIFLGLFTSKERNEFISQDFLLLPFEN